MAAISAATDATAAVQVQTRGIWFGDDVRPAFGWLSRAGSGEVTPAGSVGSAVVIAPPIGYPYWGSHRTLRVMAERLAARGHAVLRIDYDGTGDSAGDQWDPDRINAWRMTLRQAAAEMRRVGARELTLAGARLGATLALLDGAALDADRIVAWAPIESGRRHARELRLLSQSIPEADDPLRPPGTLAFAGSVFSAQTIKDLATLAVTDIQTSPAPAVLVLDDPAGSSEKTVEHLRSLGATVEHRRLAGGERALELAPEYATVPGEIVDAVTVWLGPASETPARASGGRAPSLRTDAELPWRGGRVVEHVLELAPHGHVAIETSPVGAPDGGATLVLLNPGSETHVGPGRAWVEIARDLALAGRRTVRVDFIGWGESPDGGHAPGRPYDPHCVADTLDIVKELRAAGHERVICFGLCASAWIVLQAARQGGMDGVIALNPQLYWQQGDIVEIDWNVIRAGRADEIRRINRGARMGLWSALDSLGARPLAARWLDDVARSGIPTRLLFTEADDGLTYLDERLGRYVRRLAARSTVAVDRVPEIDHPLHRTWQRPLLLSALRDALDEVESG